MRAIGSCGETGLAQDPCCGFILLPLPLGQEQQLCALPFITEAQFPRQLLTALLLDTLSPQCSGSASLVGWRTSLAERVGDVTIPLKTRRRDGTCITVRSLSSAMDCRSFLGCQMSLVLAEQAVGAVQYRASNPHRFALRDG